MEYINFITSHQEVLALIPAGLILSMFQAKLTKWFKMQSSKVKQFVTIVLTLLGTAVPAMLEWIPTQQGAEVLGAYATTLFTIMTLSYRYIVKPGQQVLLDAKETRANRLAIEAAGADSVQPSAQNVVVPPVTVDQNTNTANF